MMLWGKKYDKNTVYVDIKEPSNIYNRMMWLTTTNPQFEEFKVVKRHLPVGDLVCGQIVAERKEIHDGVKSIHDGRIWSQITKMTKYYKFALLLFSGNPEDIGTEPEIHSIFTTIADAELRHNIRVRFCGTDDYLCHYFLMLCLKIRKNLDKAYRFKTKKLTPAIHDDRLRIFSNLPLFGKLTAERIMNEFETVHEVCHADTARLRKIDKIGPKKAKYLIELFNSKNVVDFKAKKDKNE